LPTGLPELSTGDDVDDIDGEHVACAKQAKSGTMGIMPWRTLRNDL
jgi:hypothetical protein